MSTLTITAALLMLLAMTASAWAAEPARAAAKAGAHAKATLVRATVPDRTVPAHMPTNPDVRYLHFQLHELLHGPARVSLIPGGAKVAYRWTIP